MQVTGWNRRVGWAVLLAILAMACNLTAPSTPEGSAPVASPTEVESVGVPRLGEIARAAVQLQALVSEAGSRAVVWTGSGSVISSDGLILTNAHVVDDRAGEYEQLGVAVLERTDQAPELRYLAEIAAIDYAIDLAVVRIVSDLDGRPTTVELPFVVLGDSDRVEIGDSIRILGYPGIGGDTVTFTEGAISGFTSERGIDGRAWLKTDATIAGGNSGGMGLDAQGQLVAIPTTLGSGAEEGGLADCRQLVDTNRDGLVDDQDTCVPLGGFINALRPAALAAPLIEAARHGESYVQGDLPAPPPGQEVDLTSTYLTGVVFSNGVDEFDQPVGQSHTLPSGAIDLCAFWDYTGMVDGMAWSSIWFIDGGLSEGGSSFDDAWSGGPQGNWWVCIHNESGLPDGLYEFVLEVEGEHMADNSIFVGGDHDLVDLTIENQLGADICYVLLSPSQAQNWGPDRLGERESLAPGGRRSFPIASGDYDLWLLDCDGEALDEAYGLALQEDLSYVAAPD